MQRRSVLLPEPLAPIMLTTLPRGTSKDTPFSTASGPKLLCTSTTLIAGMLDTARSQWNIILCQGGAYERQPQRQQARFPQRSGTGGRGGGFRRRDGAARGARADA